MMKAVCLYFIFLFSCLSAGAQFPFSKSYDDTTLIKASVAEKSDSIKARIYYLLSLKHALVDDTAQARYYLRKAADFNKRYAYLEDIYPFYEAYVVWYDNERSSHLFLEADNNLKKYKTPEAFYLRSKAWRNFGVHQQEKDDNKGFMNAVLRAIPYSRQSGDSATTGILYQDIASVLMNQDQYAAANDNFIQAITYFNNSNPNADNLQYVYILAAKNIVLSEVPSGYPSAKTYLDNARRLIARNPPSINTLDYYLAEGMYYYVTKQYPASISSFNKGLSVSEKIQAPYTQKAIDDLKYQRYFSYYAMSDYRKALDVLLERLKNNPSLSARNRIRLYADLSNNYAALNNKAKAYDWLVKYTVLNDSLNKAGLKEQVNEMVIKFDGSEKERQILSLQLDKNKAMLTAKNRNTIVLYLSFAIVLLVISLISIYFFYRSYKNAAAQKEKIKIAEAMLTTQEEERERIARDLHDGIGGMLAAIKIELGIAGSDQVNAGTKAALDKIEHRLGDSILELRRISHNMMPDIVLRSGIEDALKDLCHSLQVAGLNVQYNFFGISDSIPVQSRVIIYRIVQELFANILKHAEAAHVFIQGNLRGNTFFLTVEDDGKGFERHKQSTGTGIGIKNIESRVDYMNGSIDIISETGKPGTSINIQLDVRD